MASKFKGHNRHRRIFASKRKTKSPTALMEVMLSEAFVTGSVSPPVFSFLPWCPHQLLPRVLIASFSLFLRTDGFLGEEIETHTLMTFLRKFPKYLVPTGKVLIKIFSTWGMELWLDPRRTCSRELHVRVMPFKTSVIRLLDPNLVSFNLTIVPRTWCPGQPCSLNFITRGCQCLRSFSSQ